MAQSYDGTFSSAVQDGAKSVKLPLQAEGNGYATEIRRNYLAAPSPTAWAPIMAQRTNYTQLLKYSDDLSQADWTKVATTASASAATDPEGGSTASKLKEDNTNSDHYAYQALVVASGVVSFGLLAKSAERTNVRLRIRNGSDGDFAIAVFSLSGDGSVVSGSGTIKKLLNGWYWCAISGTATIANSTCYVDLTSDGSTFTYVGTTGSGVYVWRATACAVASLGPAIQTTSATRAVTSPAVDADDPLAFLVEETEAEASLLEMGVAKWARMYANVPAQIVQYSTIPINKPFPGSIVGADDINLQQVTGSGTSVNRGANYIIGTYFYDIIDGYIFGPLNSVTTAVSGGNLRVTWTSHGLTGETIVCGSGPNGSLYLFNGASYSVVDANTIDLTGWSALTGVLYAAKYRRTYNYGPDRVRVRKTKTFYLPGLTLGTNAVTDIPVPSPLINDSAFLAAISATTSGFIDYDANPLTFYRGPIYEQEILAIDAADV